MPDIFINAEEAAPQPQTASKTSTANPQPVSDLQNTSHEDSPYHTHNPIASFCYFPHNVEFIDQEPDEQVILLVRRHPLTNTGWILLTLGMVFAPILFKYFPLISFMPANFQLVALLIWYLLTLAIFVQGFLSWFFSVNIITNKRVIDVDFVNLIYRKITDAKIENIEDATVQMGSVIRTLFDYGDVLIQTAAEVPEVEFQGVPHPDQIDKILSDLRMETESE